MSENSKNKEKVTADQAQEMKKSLVYHINGPNITIEETVALYYVLTPDESDNEQEMRETLAKLHTEAADLHEALLVYERAMKLISAEEKSTIHGIESEAWRTALKVVDISYEELLDTATEASTTALDADFKDYAAGILALLNNSERDHAAIARVHRATAEEYSAN